MELPLALSVFECLVDAAQWVGLRTELDSGDRP
jgi:hypothetical protein